MHKLFFGLGLFLAGIFSIVIFPDTATASISGPVINRFQAGGGAPSSASQQEFIEIYNNSSQDVQVTNWCLQYNAAQIVCFVPPDTQTQLYINEHASVLVTSLQFLTANQSVTPDFTFMNGFTTNIPGTNGSIKLVDDTRQVVDQLGWGTGVGENTSMVGNLPGGKIFQRKPTIDVNQVQDTENNSNDFIVDNAPLILPSGGVYEQYTPIDICPNIDGLQNSMPSRYQADEKGDCQQDVCLNLDGLQVTIPIGYESLDGQDCTLIPLENATLFITEILPNKASTDTGNEFIEIYNPNDRPINLKNYKLELGPSFAKTYTFLDQILTPQAYASFSDTQTSIVLPNTTASLRLRAPAGNIVNETNPYDTPGDDMAWANIDDVWQYTNQPTPGNANLKSLTGGSGGGSGSTDSLEPCPAGKYRNPDTNRCKNVESDDGLKPCAVDQVRNLETNRCRSIFSASSSGLTPCSAGQERNPATNRCRKIGSSSANSLKPCAVNQERNPETNRCRKKVPSAVASSDIKDIKSEILADNSGWFLAGSASVGLVGYGVAEWRSEIASGLRRLGSLFGKNPPTD